MMRIMRTRAVNMLNRQGREATNVFKARGVRFYCKVVRLHVCTFVTLLVHITSDVERLGSAVDSFGAKWDSSLSKNGLGFWLTTNVVPVTWRSRSAGVRAHLNCSIYGSNCSITAETVFTEPCNVRQMLDEVMEWDRPRLSRRGQSLITPRGTLVEPAGSRAHDIITSYSNKQQAVGCR